MATASVDDRFKYVPNRTLGRSGYVPGLADMMHEKVIQLDALLCFMTAVDDDGNVTLMNMNDDIQHAVLRLASSMATELNEAQEELLLEKIRQSNGKTNTPHIERDDVTHV